MKIKEIDTKRIKKDNLIYHINHCCSSIKFYGKCNNMIFMMIGQNTAVYDLDNNKFIIFNKRGISYPVVDKNNNCYFMIIRDEFDNDSYFWDGYPKFRDTSVCHMYDDDHKIHDLECFCNFFDENNQTVQPINKYMTNIYQFNSLLYGSKEFQNITYRDIDNEFDFFNENNNYASYDNLPSHINPMFKQILSSYSLEKMMKEKIKSNNKDSFNLDVVYKKWKYSVINQEKGLMIAYDSNIKNVEVVANDIVILKNNDNQCALYDINKGYLINFEDGFKFNNVYQLNTNTFILEDDNVCRLLINEHVFDKTYKDIYLVSDDIIVTENFKELEFYSTDGHLMFNINSNYFYKCDDDIFFYEEDKFYNYNFVTGIKKEINIISPFTLEDGSELSLSIDEILQNYTHFYNDRENDNFMLFKEKKYGIMLELEHDLKTKRWFCSKEEQQRYLQVLLDYLINLPIHEEDVRTKRMIKAKKKMP